MSQKDLQFIERALERPWIFYVYFWKWPRIVRQACAEYDLLSKERDAAKDAHEQALRANRIVQDWIYTTHKLDMTADLRAIWTAGKRLSVLLLFLGVAMPLNAQLPPILRQYFTTNAHVLSSGAGVLTNNGVGTPGTLGWLNLSSIVGSSQIWTQDTVIHPILSSRIQIHTNGWIQAAPEVEFYSMLTNSGVIAGDFRNATGLTLDPRHGGHVGGNFTNSIDCRATAWGGGLAGGWFVSATNCYVDASDGSFASGYFSQATGSHAEASQGSYAGVESTLANNSYVEASKGSFCGADVGAANGSFLIATEGSIALAFSAYSHGCFIGSAHGSFGGGTFFEATNSFIDVFRGSIGAGDFRNSTNASITVANGAIGSGNFLQAKDSSITASAAFAMVDAIGTTNGSVNASGGSVAVGILRNNERLRAVGTSVGALAIGRNVVSTNNWTVGLNGTNDTPLSIALVNNGVQFQVTSNGNIGTVRGVSGYSWPTAHAVGALTNDGAGALGWFNGYAPATGGAYIATNNGTGWLTTFITQTNHSQIVFTNGSKIGATAINTLSLTNAHLVFSADNTFDIGASGANRPRSIFAGNQITADSLVVNQYVFGASKGGFYFISDGVIRVSNNGGNDFSRLQFGGTSATFPGLKRDAAGLAIVGADGVGTSSNNLAIAGSLSITNSTTLANVTADRVAVFNSGKQLTNSAAVDTTELETLDGVTSAIQTQLNGKQVGSAVLTNLATTRAVTNMTVTTITNVGVSLYTVPSGCTYIWVECIGGGGGGGGVDGAASQSAAGGGGGSGAYCSTNIGSPAASYIVTVGTNGLGGAGTGGNSGTIGGTTLFTNILTALGGSGGAGKSSAAAVSITLGGAGALETATGRVYTGGNPGQNGICVSATLAVSGGGAGSHFGGGGAPQTADVGQNATGKGAGGSGAAVITNADRAGGNGSPGIIVIREFYQ